MAVRAYWKGSYEEALKTLVKRKAAGKPVKPAEREEKPDNVISLMDALRQSLKGKGIGKAVGAFPGAPDNAPPRKKSAPLAGAGAQGELAAVMPGLVRGIHVLAASQ
jgi:hypothetical protein